MIGIINLFQSTKSLRPIKFVNLRPFTNKRNDDDDKTKDTRKIGKYANIKLLKYYVVQNAVMVTYQDICQNK